jgi:3',5'-cyclic AMP phosphodiesterase CpdA
MPDDAVDEVRLAHCSDIHVTAAPLSWRWRDLASKRTTAWLNLKLGRGRRFRDASRIAAAAIADVQQRGCQHIVFSGDATTMGFASEFREAAKVLATDLPGIAVPGNHDYYTPAAAASGLFERAFECWQAGERGGGERYPFAQRVGHCWLIGVNTACANFLIWDARGRMGRAQGERLRELLERLSPGPRILVTHYPLYLADGQPEHRWRLLRDGDELRRIAVEGGVGLWLHGHRHTGYVVPAVPERPFPIICAGSATQSGRWSWNEYVIRGRRLQMTRRTWAPEREGFVDADRIELELPG